MNNDKNCSFGKIIILNGVPRAGKSSIAKAIQETLEGIWLNIGVDNYMNTLPKNIMPGIGLRPGGERADLEEAVKRMYIGLYKNIALHSSLGFNVVVDVGHHDDYASKTNIFSNCLDIINDYPKYVIGVECSIEDIINRRMATGYPSINENGEIISSVLLWQEKVHENKKYDLIVNTSLHSSHQCAKEIQKYIYN